MKGLTLGAGGVLAAGAQSAFAASESKIADHFLELYDRIAALSLEYAEAMPAESYGFKAVPEIRSFEEEMLHIAGSSIFFVSYVGGEAPDLNFQPENPTKEMVIDLMGKSNAHVRSVIAATSDEEMAVVVETFAGPLSKQAVCWFMRDHITHHRARCAVLLRLKGVKPPSYIGV